MPSKPPRAGYKAPKRTNWGHSKTAAERGYGAAWKRIRKRILQRDRYLCQACLEKQRATPATQVDHILSKAKGGTDEESNLRALCRPCHDDKTMIDAGRRPRVRIALDGWPEE